MGNPPEVDRFITACRAVIASDWLCREGSGDAGLVMGVINKAEGGT